MNSSKVKKRKLSRFSKVTPLPEKKTLLEKKETLLQI